MHPTTGFSSSHISNEGGRRRELQRFGYRSMEASDLDHALIWRQLRSDFPGGWDRVEFSALAGEARTAAMRYCAHRASLDDLIDRCDEMHMEIFHRGPDRARVEGYAAARDRYEDAVERFGELRVALQAALAASPPS